MNERIQRYLKYTQENNLMPPSIPIEFDEWDENYSEPVRNAKRLTEMMLNQPVFLQEDCELAGLTNFRDWSNPVPQDLFPRAGHTAYGRAGGRFYRKPVENLCSFEWQHSSPNLPKALRLGLRGYRKEINESRIKHVGQTEHLNFLEGLELFIHGLEQRVEQYRAYCVEESVRTADPARSRTLRKMASRLERVPSNPAETFDEAVQAVYIFWHCLSDSLGRLDQYLYPYYKRDMENGTLDREHAKELLQELFLMINRTTRLESPNDPKGAECHFVVGGYTIDHEDGFNALSELIVESMMEMPVIRPQITLRWNRKTPFSVLKMMMDHERKDVYKRIAFVNDEPRIKSLLEIAGLPWETAYDYIMCGCNEPAFQGGIDLSGNKMNVLRTITDVFEKRKIEVLECQNFDEFYALFEKVLRQNFETAFSYTNKFNDLRSGDCNIMSSLVLDGCIERAQSATRGGAYLVRTGFSLIGTTSLIDSLCIIRQFIFDEKRVTMAEMADALANDWQGFEDLHQQILRDGKFFGNNDEMTNAMAQRFNRSVYDIAYGRLNAYGTQFMFGNLTGYHPYFRYFGSATGATPDGRVAGSDMSFGGGQSYGKDKDGVTSHLLAVAQADPTGIMCGPAIMNLTMERETIENEESFDKFVHLVETYFQAGGLHLQLNYISREELLKAKENPRDYKTLRVRVSGYSGYFTQLSPETQDTVIDRTSHRI